jgi:dCMP deaminase
MHTDAFEFAGRTHRVLKQDGWDKYFMDMCKHVASRSKDQNTKLGCVIVSSDHATLATGYNSFPRGIDDNRVERQQRPEKYFWFEHAERNAIYMAARHGVALKGAKMFCAWMPCADCARAIIQVGITEVIFDGELYNARRGDPVWEESFQRTIVMFAEAGVQTRTYEAK